MSAQPDFVLGQREYAEVVGALIAVRRFAAEMADVFDGLGRSEQPEGAGAQSMIEATDRALDALRYDGPR
jgi:hypothetical protein